MPGYCMTGSRTAAIPPVSISTIASTHANTGRSMKKCEITDRSALRDAAGRFALRLGFFPADLDGLHVIARPHLLQPVEDHALAGVKAGADQPIVADHASSGDASLRHDVAVADHEHDGIAALVARDAALRNEEGVAFHRLRELSAHEHAGQQLAARIREQRP